MKNLLLILVVFVGISTTAKAQSQQTLAKQAALDLCGCVEPFMKKLHPAIIQLMEDTYEKGEKTAETNFTKYLEANPGEMGKVMQDVQALDEFGKGNKMEDCFDKVGDKYEDLKLKANNFEEIFYQNIYFEKDCKLTALLVKIGKKDK